METSPSLAVEAQSLRTPGVTPVPTETPQGWSVYEGERFIVRVPRGWQAIQPTDEDLQAAFAAFQQTNPDLAAIVGEAESLHTATFQASNPESRGTGLADNLNIRRVELGNGAIENLAEITELIAAQYRQLSFDVQEVEAGMVAGQRAAARIVYAFQVTGASGRVIPAEGMQYLIVTPADLWILSYTAARDRFAELKPIFEQSAQSFRVK